MTIAERNRRKTGIDERCERVEWIRTVKDRNQRRHFVNTIKQEHHEFP
jgi:hypothetical protein